jgi:hypothetical protein
MAIANFIQLVTAVDRAIKLARSPLRFLTEFLIQKNSCPAEPPSNPPVVHNLTWTRPLRHGRGEVASPQGWIVRLQNGVAAHSLPELLPTLPC